MIDDLDKGFRIEEVRLQFALNSTLCKLLVRHNHAFLVLKSGTIHRINLDSPQDIVTIQLSLSAGCFIEDSWIDTKGYHLIVRSSKNDYYYINKQSTKYHTLTKLRGLNINCIVFLDSTVTPDCTGPILISTRNSLILEACIIAFKEMYLKSLLKNKYSILHIVQNSELNDNGTLTCVIDLFTLDKRLLCFNTKIPQQPAFNTCVFQGLTKSDPIAIDLDGLTNISSYGSPLSYVQNSSLCITDFAISDAQSFQPQKTYLPFKVESYILTDYYILFLVKNNKLAIMNKFTFELINTVDLDYLNDLVIGLSYDEVQQTFWMYSQEHVYEILIDFEKTGMVESLVSQGRFTEALKVVNAGSGDKVIIDFILKNEAYEFLRQHKYEEAIDLFVRTNESIDRVARKLIDLKDSTFLRQYLARKLETFTNQFKAQKIVLTSWISELYIQELNGLEGSTSYKKKAITDKPLPKSPQYDNIEKEFHQFLILHKADLDRDTIFELIKSHNRTSDFLFFATLMDDYRNLLKHHIFNQSWDKALSILQQKKDYDLVYSSGTVLLCNSPKATVDTWIDMIDGIEPLKLLPALLSYNKMIATPQNIDITNNQVIRFLSFLVYDRQSRNKLLLDALFSILITYRRLESEDVIITHLNHLQSMKSKACFDYNYDLIMRLCSKHNRTKSLIFLFSMDQKLPQAVKLALDNDLLEIAVKIVDDATLENRERKHLWLQISKKLISKVIVNKEFVTQNKDTIFSDTLKFLSKKTDNDGIYVVLQYLMRKCDLLTINDLLPLFPEFIVIDNFKDALVEALERLSDDLNVLSMEMTNTINDSANVRQKISEFQSTNFQVIRPYDSCELCHKILVIRKFIVFPCNHAFHQDCLVKKILSSNDYKSKSSLLQLQKEIKSNNRNHKKMIGIKSEIDTLVSSSCCLCSDIKIGEIDEPIIKPGDKEIDSWKV